MLEQLKGFPRYTPKETLKALEYAVEAVDLFNDRLGTKADAMRLAKLKAVLQQAVKNIKKGNEQLINSCEKYVGDPTQRNDKELLGDINSLQNEIRAAMKELNPGDVGKNRNNGNYIANVDPRDIKELGEAIKRSDDTIRKQVDDAPPKELAAESDANINRADRFTDMVDSLAKDSRNPAFKNTLNDLTAKLRPAIDNLAKSTNDYLYDPDSKRRGDDLKVKKKKKKKETTNLFVFFFLKKIFVSGLDQASGQACGRGFGCHHACCDQARRSEAGSAVARRVAAPCR